MTRNCKQCGKEYTTSNYRNYFCCVECAIKYYRKHDPSKIMRCEVCGRKFVPWHKRQVTCGDEECMKECHKKREAERKTSRASMPKTNKPKPKTYASFISRASIRWASMSWIEVTKENDYYGITYPQSQLMAENNTLPEDYGLKRKKAKK